MSLLYQGTTVVHEMHVCAWAQRFAQLALCRVVLHQNVHLLMP